MKSPSPPGAPVDMRRMRRWVQDFANYRHQVTEPRIERWLDQFDLPHIDLAARVLDCVDFVANEQIAAAYRDALASMSGWSKSAREREGQWRFAAFSASAGESGDVMLQRFRHANNLASKRYNPLFVHRSELPTSGLATGDSIVFVDDFSATGTQVVDGWPLIQELLPEGPEVHLVLVAATSSAINRIGRETELTVHAQIVLREEDALFSEACTRFTVDEKSVLAQYCRGCGPQSAARYAESGYLIVFAHGCPNNSLPILHAVNNEWEGLFRRYD